MLTKNYFNILFGNMRKKEDTAISVTAGDNTSHIMYLDSDTEKRYRLEVLGTTFAENFANVSTRVSGSVFVFGTSDTPPSVNDYTLAGEFISGIAIDQSLTSYSTGDTNVLTQRLYVRNTGASTITIKEVGRTGNLSYHTTSWSTTTDSCSFLIERTVLDEPLTLAAGESGIITLELTMPVA